MSIPFGVHNLASTKPHHKQRFVFFTVIGQIENGKQYEITNDRMKAQLLIVVNYPNITHNPIRNIITPNNVNSETVSNRHNKH